MAKALKIRDLTLRDGQQSLFATRLRNESIRRLLPLYRKAGFYIMEVWGGAVPDAMMRYLDESPWDRLRLCSEELKGVSLLAGLSRGRNLLGYLPYPSYVLDTFYQEAIKNGLEVVRIYDSLNDLDNLRDSVDMINALGGIPDTAICYTIDPKEEPAPEPKKKGFFARLFGGDNDDEELTQKVFTDDYFVKKAKDMEAMGAGILTLKDMTGLIRPSRIYTLMPKLKHAVDIPVDFHTHSTPGYGLGAVLTAILKGVDIVDTNIWWFAGGAAAPAIELVWLFCKKLDLKIDVDMDAVAEIRRELKSIREELADFDMNRDRLPHDFDEWYAKMPPEIDAEFDRAIQAASDNDDPALMKACWKIEDYFGFPAPDRKMRKAEIPDSTYSNIVTHLRSLKEEDLLGETLELVGKVRKDAGLPPLVTPIGHIIGTQAAAIAIDRKKGLPDYTTLNNQFVALVKGEYGHTPSEIDPSFREYITGNPEETAYDTTSFREPPNPELPEYGGVKLARNDEEYLLLEMLPSVASVFLKKRRANEYKDGMQAPLE
ncbi:MAG: carboxylase [Muribaculaceae bacterium]|nr:carboxylase [Muribaculaceae bacterium]